jgi:hypothetical protein
MKLRAVGPYVFLKYHGNLGVMAKITSIAGKIFSVNAGNLLPLKETFSERMLRFQQPTIDLEEISETQSSGEDFDWGSDLD